MDLWRLDLILPVLGALAAGALIGYEREYRARAAGFRTHTLVSLASALLMLASQHQVDWAGSTTPPELMRIDPARMAHGVLTGIGFLCGGVIFREGASIHGLTTAASLWATSALGMLFGVGFYELAIGGTLVTLLVLAGFRLIDHRTVGVSVANLVIRYRRQGAPNESEFCRLLSGVDLRVKRTAHSLTERGEVIQYSAMVSSKGPMAMDTLTQALQADPRVIEYDIEPRNG